MHVNAGFPGSTNDAYILNGFSVKTAMIELHVAGFKDYYLIGRYIYLSRNVITNVV